MRRQSPVHAEWFANLDSDGAADASGTHADGEGGEGHESVVLHHAKWGGDEPLLNPHYARVARFLDRKTAQRELADRGGLGEGAGRGHVVRVRDVWTDDSGAWAAEDRYPITAADLVRGRVRMQSHVLWEIVSGVVGALRRIEQTAAGRPHGNLSAGVVHIDDTGGWGQWRIGLSDPLGPEEMAHDRVRLKQEDLRALGRLIHELVLHKPFRVLGGYPVNDGAEWKGLWKTGGDWLSLVNRLLDPKAPAGVLTLEEVEREIEKLKAKPKRPVKRFVAAAGLALAVLGAGGGYLVTRPDPSLPANFVPAAFEMERFRDWCEVSDAWFVRFVERDFESVRDALERDEYLRETIVATMRGAEGLPLDPEDATGIDVFQRTELPERLTEAEADERLGGLTLAAMEVVGKIDEAVGQWAAPVTLRSLAETWSGDRTWDGVASVLRPVADGVAVRPDATPEDGLGLRLAEAARAKARAAETEAAWGTIAEAGERLEVAGAPSDEGDPRDPMLSAFGERAAAMIADGLPTDAGPIEMLRALEERTQEIAGLGEDLVAFVETRWDRVDREAMSAGSGTLRRVREGAEIDGSLYRSWLIDARRIDFQEPDPALDPRPEWAAGAVDGEPVAEAIDRMRTEFSALRAEFPDLAPRRFDTIAERVGFRPALELELVNDEFNRVMGLSWRNRNTDDIRSSLSDLSVRLLALNNAAFRLSSSLRVEPEVYLNQLRARLGVSPAGLGSIDAAFRDRRDALIGRIDAQNEIGELQLAVDELEDFLNGLERSLTLAFEPESVPDRLNESLLDAAVRARRSIAAAEALSAATWTGEGYDDSESYRQTVQALLERERGWLDALARLLADYAAIETLLDNAYALDEADESGETIDDRTARWGESEVLADTLVRDSLAPILDRVGGLRTIADDADRSRLAALVIGAESEDGGEGGEQITPGPGAPAEAVIAAYWRLGELAEPSAWPATSQELEQELNAMRQALAAAGTIGSAARREDLQDRITAEAQSRWTRAMRNAANAEEIAFAARLRGAFGVALEALPADLAYNAALYDFSNEWRRGPQSDAALRPRVRAAAEDLRRLASSAADSGTPVDTLWLDRLSEVGLEPDPNEAVLDPSAVGPATVGWEVGEIEEIDELVYHWPSVAESELTIEFVLLDPDRTDAVDRGAYLSTREVSLELFNEIVTRAEAWAEIGAANVWSDLSSSIEGGPASAAWRGPRVWAWNPVTASLAANETWLPVHAQVGPLNPPLTFPAYPASLVAQDDPTRISEEQGRPSVEMPINTVSAEAATRVTGLIGCRLPTPQEWRAAMDWYESGAVNAEGWNLRDQAWLRQRDHIAGITAQLDAADAISLFGFPDDGVLLPDDAPTGADASVRAADDGTLWLDPVGRMGPARRIPHLVGNVAEFVQDRVTVDGENGPEERLATWIIGGSSSSDPTLDVGEPQPVLGRRRRFGFSDAGFRLAFTVDGKIQRAVSWRLERLFDEPGYILAAAEAVEPESGTEEDGSLDGGAAAGGTVQDGPDDSE